MNEDVLLIWDISEKPTDGYNDIIYWSSYTKSHDNKKISIPMLVEQDSDRFRSKYLSLIYDLGESIVEGKRIIDLLEIRHRLSFWWMTLLVYGCNIDDTSPQINNIIKLFAFESFLKGKDFKNIKIVSADEDLIEAIKILSIKFGIKSSYQLVTKKQELEIPLFKRIYIRTPKVLQSLIWLFRYLVTRWQLKGVGVQEWKSSSSTTTFVSYLFNLDPKSTEINKFKSPYWTELTNLMTKHKKSSNWLHIFVEDDVLYSAKKARKILQQFNQSQADKQIHVTLSSFLSLKLVINVLVDWYSIAKLNKTICNHFKKKTSFFWPLLKENCQDSFIGISAISNLLYLRLFEQAMRDISKQEIGLFLQENQSWEFGFIHAWRESKHAEKLIGVPHSTVRYWDLRYFFDPRSYSDSVNNSLPLPDYVGVNGPLARNMYLNGGYRKNRLINLEALRYLYLSKNEFSKDNQYLKKYKKVVLVLGDYNKENTNYQIDLLSRCSPLLDEKYFFIIKFHPNCIIDLSDFSEFDYTISKLPINELMPIVNVAYTSNTTSAAIDAYSSGLKVISALNPNSVNLSPLRGNNSIEFVSTFKELNSALSMPLSEDNFKDLNDIFYINPSLPYWKSALQIV